MEYNNHSRHFSSNRCRIQGRSSLSLRKTKSSSTFSVIWAQRGICRVVISLLIWTKHSFCRFMSSAEARKDHILADEVAESMSPAGWLIILKQWQNKQGQNYIIFIPLYKKNLKRYFTWLCFQPKIHVQISLFYVKFKLSPLKLKKAKNHNLYLYSPS